MSGSDLSAVETANLQTLFTKAVDGRYGVHVGFRDPERASVLTGRLGPSYALQKSDGWVYLVYLVTPGQEVAAHALVHDLSKENDEDVVFEIDQMVLTGEVALHDDDVLHLAEGGEFHDWGVTEIEVALTGTDADVLGDLSQDILDTPVEIEAAPIETKLNDATILGELSQDILNTPVQISIAANATEKKFKVVPQVPFSAVLNSDLSKIRVGKKDGKCFVLGALMEGRRVNNAVTRLHMMGLDVDSGAPMDETIAKLQSMGLFFVAYTTHSHGSRFIEIKKDRFHKWASDDGRPVDPTTEGVKAFLTWEGKYTADVIDSARYVETRHEATGIQIIVETRPIDKFRLVFLLEKPFVIAEYPGPQKAAITAWGDMILGMGASLGIKVDRAARDCSRLFYLPSKAPGATNARIVVNAGSKLDWTTIKPVSIREHNATSSDPFDTAGAAMGGKGDGSRPTSPGGTDLKSWAGKRAHGFQISQVFKDYCDDRLRKETAPGKYTCECPFDDEHSNAGDSEDPGCFIQDAGVDATTFAFRCSHDSCASRDRLDMLQKALTDGWFTDSVLTDAAYDVAGVDEEDSKDSERDDDDGQEPANEPEGEDTLEDIESIIAKIGKKKPSVSAVKDILRKMLSLSHAECNMLMPDLAFKVKIKKDVLEDMLSEMRPKKQSASTTEADEPKTGLHHFDDVEEAVATLNAEIAFVERGNKTAIYQKNREANYWKTTEAARDIFLPWTYGKKMKGVFPAWLASSDRDHRTDVVFNPYRHGTIDPTPAQHLNLFKGLAIEPKDGDAMDYYRHVFHVICGGNTRLFDYYIAWMAQMVQEPAKKPGAALVLRGLKGAGKGIFAEPWMLAWGVGRHSTKAGPDRLTSRFNEYMANKIFVLAEEAVWGGDRKTDSLVKDMITGTSFLMEDKFLSAVNVLDARRFVFLSNDDNPIRATPDERRYAVAVASPAQKHNQAYWDNLSSRIASGEISAALTHDLLNLDLDTLDVNLRTPPRTAALLDQILLTLPPEDKWVRGWLTAGTFLDADGNSLLSLNEPTKWQTERINVSKESIYVSYRAEVRAYTGKEITPDDIGRSLIGFFRVTDDEPSLITGDDSKRNYVLPPLPKLRAFYEKHYLPLGRMAENEADFIRVKSPKVAMYPMKPVTDDDDAAKRYEAEIAEFENERVEVQKDADAYIKKMFGTA